MDEIEDTKIIAFLCNWCSYAGADLAGVSRLQMPTNVRNVRVMCSSRVNPVFLLKAFLGGADGLLVAGCHPKDCHYTRGTYFTRRRIVLLKNILETLGLEDDRLKLTWISASEGRKYSEEVKDLAERVNKLGPNPTRSEIFL